MWEGAGSSTGYFIVSVSYLLVILTIVHALFQNSLQFYVPANCCQDWRRYRILKFQSSRISAIQTARFFFFTALLSALPPLRFAAWGFQSLERGYQVALSEGNTAMIPLAKQPQWERKRFAGRHVIPNSGLRNEALTESLRYWKRLKQSRASRAENKEKAYIHQLFFILQDIY